jgi:hypothetical protein
MCLELLVHDLLDSLKVEHLSCQWKKSNFYRRLEHLKDRIPIFLTKYSLRKHNYPIKSGLHQ